MTPDCLPNVPNVAFSSDPSVLCSWTRVLLQALEDRGYDSAGIASRAGLRPDQLDLPESRLPLAATTRLWKLAALELDDDSFGLWVSKYSSQTSMHALGYAFMASHTLREALERVARFSSMVSDVSTVTLSDGKDGYTRVEWQPRLPGVYAADEAMEAILALILRSCRKLQGYDFAPQEAALRRSRPESDRAYRDFFRCPLIFAAPNYRMVFARADLERQLTGGNEALAIMNDRVSEDYLARCALHGVTGKLTRLLQQELPNGEQAQERYASLLGLSVRSLQRKLNDEHTSFNRVLNETRLALARAHLDSGRHSITEVAFLLGFSDASAFSRAFHRWTGVYPSSYRS